MRWITKRRRKAPRVTFTFRGTFLPGAEECRFQGHNWQDPMSADTVCLRCETRRTMR